MTLVSLVFVFDCPKNGVAETLKTGWHLGPGLERPRAGTVATYVARVREVGIDLGVPRLSAGRLR